MQSGASTVDDYLSSLPEDRRRVIAAVRDVIRANLDADYEEGIQYGAIGYYVPHRVFPAGYHCDPKQPLPFAALASKKNHFSLYLMGVYCGCSEEGGEQTADARWFRAAWEKTGRKLDMGKACVRFKKLDDVALDVVAEAIRRVPAHAYIERYQQVLAMPRAPRTRPAAKPATKRTAKPAANIKPSKSTKARSVSR